MTNKNTTLLPISLSFLDWWQILQPQKGERITMHTFFFQKAFCFFFHQCGYGHWKHYDLSIDRPHLHSLKFLQPFLNWFEQVLFSTSLLWILTMKSLWPETKWKAYGRSQISARSTVPKVHFHESTKAKKNFLWNKIACTPKVHCFPSYENPKLVKINIIQKCLEKP